MPAHLENSAVATGLEKLVFIPVPKKSNAKECSNYCTTALISHTSKVMIKILQARLQQYVNFQMFKLDLEKAEEQISNCQHLLDHRKSRGARKTSTSALFTYAKAFDCVDHYKLWKILKEMGIPDHLTF